MKTIVNRYAAELIVAAFFTVLTFFACSVTAQTTADAYSNLDADTHIQAYNIHESTAPMNEMDVIYSCITLKNSLEDMIEWVHYDVVEGHISDASAQDYVEQYQGMLNQINYLLYERRED